VELYLHSLSTSWRGA